MATKTKAYSEMSTSSSEDSRAKEYEYEYKKDYVEDWDIHRNYIDEFDAYEAMLIGQVYDSVSRSVDGSKITDSYAATLAIERAARVVGKLPEGKVEAAGKGDAGKGAFMDVLRQKWIYPNANAQHNFQTKLRLWQLYSSVYGYMPMFYDWDVSPSGYAGPNCWLWSPRNLIPQQGRVSINDMDYLTACTWVGEKFIDDLLENPEKDDGWDRKALKLLKEMSAQHSEPDTEKETYVERKRTERLDKKGIQLATRYEAGKDGEWITFCPDHSYVEVRRLKNPHKNGRIPFVIKYSQPLFDSFYGMGDFQRAKPLQFARDGLTNFYFKGIKLNLVQPIVANANGVIKHTLDYREGGVMMETVPNSIRSLNVSTAGLNTYQAAQTSLTGSLLSLYGSQNASIPGAEALNPSQGKTPAAINMYNEKEATRDGQERLFLETAIEELTDGFFSLVANIGTEDIPINLFSEDIVAIQEAGLEDVMGLFDGTFKPDASGMGGQLKIKPGSLKGVEYRFHIEPGSTMKISKEEQIAKVKDMMDSAAKFQNILKEDQRWEVNFGQAMQTLATLADVPGMDKFITFNDGAPSPREAALMEEIEQIKQQFQQFQEEARIAVREAEVSNLAPPPMDVGGVAFNDPELGVAAQQLLG